MHNKQENDFNLKSPQSSQQIEDSQMNHSATKYSVPSTIDDSYYHIFDSWIDGCQIIGFDWHYLYVNDVAAQHSGRKKEKLIGQTLMACYAGIEQTSTFELLQRCMQDRSAERVQDKFTYPDGRVAWFQLSIQPVPEGIFICSLDITKSKQQEHQLLCYASIQENFSDVVITCDLDFHIQSWNSAAERMYGWNANEVIGKLMDEVLLTNCLSGYDSQQNLRMLFQEGYWKGELEQRHKDGHVVHILGSKTLLRDANEIPIGIININHDISDRKKVELELREAERRYHSLFEQAHDAVFIIDFQGNHLEANQRAAEMLGYSVEEIQSLGIQELSVEVPDSESVLKRLLAGETVPMYERLFQRKDGSVVPTEINVELVYDIHGKPSHIQSVVRDITAHKETEKTLREKLEYEQEFQKYLQALHDITIELTSIPDLDTFYKRAIELGLERLDFDRLALFLHDPENDLAIGTYGTDSLGKLSSEQHIQFRPSSTEVMRQALLRAERFIYEKTTPLYTALKHTGAGWNAAAVLWNGTESVGWLVADNGINNKPETKPLLDILALYALTLGTLLVQKRATIELAQSEERFRQIAENFDQVIFMRSGDNRELLYINRAVESLWKQPIEQLYDNPNTFMEIIHPDDIDYVRQQLTTQSYKDLGLSDFEYRIVPIGGNIRWVRVRTFPVKNKHGLLLQRVGVIEDVTERKLVEKTLKQALEQEQELNDLKTRFVSMASHEFRTPLATILAATETLSAYRHKLDEEKIEKRLNIIKEQIDYLKGIMDDVLTLACIQARKVEFNPVRVNPDRLIHSILDEFLSIPDAKHRIKYMWDEQTQEAYLDRKLMRQIITNLISNALKYSAMDKLVSIHLGQSEDNLVLSVSDEGIGIPDADLQHLFEPFHRASNVGTISGTGLGLTIMRESVELHGGEITIKSEVDVGTTFSIHIPLRA